MTDKYLTARGWLTKKERILLHDLAARVPDGGTILNIGIEYGASVHCVTAGVGDNDVMIVAVDLIGSDLFEGGDDDNVTFIKGNSATIANEWDTPLDFLFVDGDHGKSGVLLDCKFADHVVSGGVVAFHDCYEWPPLAPAKTVRAICPGVNAAVDEWFANSTGWQELEPVDSIRLFRLL